MKQKNVKCLYIVVQTETSHFLVCVVDADTLMLGRVIYYIFPSSSSYSTFHLIMCPPLLSSLKTSAIDFKLYYNVQTGLNSRSNIFLEI